MAPTCCFNTDASVLITGTEGSNQYVYVNTLFIYFSIFFLHCCLASVLLLKSECFFHHHQNHFFPCVFNLNLSINFLFLLTGFLMGWKMHHTDIIFKVGGKTYKHWLAFALNHIWRRLLSLHTLLRCSTDCGPQGGAVLVALRQWKHQWNLSGVFSTQLCTISLNRCF